MIILDTDVVSESMKRHGSPNVAEWLNRYPLTELCITSITAAELLRGVALLPQGRRKSELAAAVGNLLETSFEGRVLAFDERAAVAFAALSARRHLTGMASSMADTMIAAIAETEGADALATRNVSDFGGTTVRVINPWTA